jgi:hypothetical protein
MADSVVMGRPQFSLATLLLLTAALPMWALVIVIGFQSRTISAGTALFVLCGITVATQRLVRQLRDGWALATLIAGMIALGTLSIAWWFAQRA